MGGDKGVCQLNLPFLIKKSVALLEATALLSLSSHCTDYDTGPLAAWGDLVTRCFGQAVVTLNETIALLERKQERLETKGLRRQNSSSPDIHVRIAGTPHKRHFAEEVVKALQMGRSSCIDWCAWCSPRVLRGGRPEGQSQSRYDTRSRSRSEVGPWARASKQHLGAGRGKEILDSPEPTGGMPPCDALILALWDLLEVPTFRTVR